MGQTTVSQEKGGWIFKTKALHYFAAIISTSVNCGHNYSAGCVFHRFLQLCYG